MGRFRQRLVPLLDGVLDRLEHDRTLTFHLDGQAILADDYLSLRPEARERMTRLVEAGRLTVGPWYVLADELLAGDEPLVRNLIEGRRRSAELGGWLPVGYSPDAFGHPDALPTILAGFGIQVAVLWRGYGDAGAADRDLFHWRGPDGAGVLVHHLPRDGYEYGRNLPTDRPRARRRWSALEAALAPRALVPVLLILNGADHHALQPGLRAALNALRAVSRCDVEAGTLMDYFEAVVTALAAHPRRLPTVTGELRWSGGHAWSLQGVTATRTALKQQIAEGAVLLTRWAEPQAALADVPGGRDRRWMLADLWRRHLATLSHDVLAGSIADPVAADVTARTREVREAARDVLVASLDDRLGQDPVRRRDVAAHQPCLVVVNPSPRPRTDVVEATVTLFGADVVVGRAAAAEALRPLPSFALADARGRVVGHQVLAVSHAYERLDSPLDYPDQDRVWAVRVATRVRVPAFGLARLDVQEGRAPRSPHGERVVASARAIEGAWGRVATGRTGFALTARGAARVVPRLVSERDEGDTYTIEPVPGDRAIVARCTRPRVIWPGPLVGAIGCRFRIGNRARGRMFARMDVGSALLRLVVEGENRQGNHRIRVQLPVRSGGEVTADMLYGPVRRSPPPTVPGGAGEERPATSAPMHRYVLAGGWFVCARGLHEYELLSDGTLAVTLLRAVGDLSRANLQHRPGHAAWPGPTPGAQGLGRFRAEMGIAYLGRDDPAVAERYADEFHAPLAGLMYRAGIDVPAEVPGPALTGAGLAFRALKPREDGSGVVVRCVNVSRRRRRGTLVWPTGITRAFRARLDETLLEELPLGADRRSVSFAVAPRAVATIVVET